MTASAAGDDAAFIKVDYSYMDSEPVVGATIRLYQLGVRNGSGIFVRASAFNAFQTERDLLDPAAWPELAEELAMFVNSHEIAPAQSTKVRANGYASFPVAGASLPDAMYLVVCVPHVADDYTYTVAKVETLDPSDPDAMVDPDYDLTLFTCTVGGASRVTVRCLRAG